MKSTSGINQEKLGQKAGLGLKDVLQRLNAEILVLDRALLLPTFIMTEAKP